MSPSYTTVTVQAAHGVGHLVRAPETSGRSVRTRVLTLDAVAARSLQTHCERRIPFRIRMAAFNVDSSALSAVDPARGNNPICRANDAPS